MPERLVIVGGDAAGMSAASNARRANDDLEIVVLEKGPWTSYSACGIPYFVAGDVESIDDLIVRTPQEFRDNLRIDVRTEHEVTAIDTDAGHVEVQDLSRGRGFTLGYDELLIATGGEPVRPDVPGVDLEFVHGVQTLADGVAVHGYADRVDCGHVVIVGGGYIGLEMAESFIRWGADVTLVEAAPEVMGTLDPDMGALVRAALVRHEIEVRCNTPIQGFEPGKVLTESGAIDADLVVLGTGVRARSALAVEAGVPTGVKGAIRVDRRQHTEVDGVWAAGDCAESYHRVTGRPTHIALGTVANKQGRIAGINLGGGYATFPGVVGTAVTRMCNLEVGRTGLDEGEAAAAGFGFVTARIEATTRAGYLPAAKQITVKLVAEQGTGRLLGGQVIGEEGAAKRVDVLATALTAELTVHDLEFLDLGYAPPVSPGTDPLQVAARKLAREL
jgi:NADPH-dependent 2,4-dienoyl-CoA reductase/sulfur reductase-like enzyme